jgi:hypothetical protein
MRYTEDSDDAAKHQMPSDINLREATAVAFRNCSHEGGTAVLGAAFGLLDDRARPATLEAFLVTLSGPERESILEAFFAILSEERRRELLVSISRQLPAPSRFHLLDAALKIEKATAPTAGENGRTP